MKEQIEEMRKDLIEIFDEEYEKRRMITPDFTAEKMTAKDYRKQEWISVDDRLPTDDKCVLCWYEYYRFGRFNRMYQTYGIGCFENGIWGGEVSTGMKCRVIAWMPLPQPPKMKGGAE